MPPSFPFAHYAYDFEEDEATVDHRATILQFSDALGGSSCDVLFILPLRGDHSRR